MTILSKAVTQGADGTWDFTCPGVLDSPCGSSDGPFTSTGWPTKKDATSRGRQHFDEHKGGNPSPELADFRGDTQTDGVRVGDL